MTKGAALLVCLVFLTALCLTAPLPVSAEPKTIIVPDDYASISSAIGNATTGDTIFVRAGTYEEGTWRINKTLSIVGEGADSTRINFNPPWYNITISICESYIFYYSSVEVYADNFKMSGFTTVNNFSKSGFTTADDFALSNCELGILGGEISITGNGTKITENQILSRLIATGSYLDITGNKVSYGLSIMGDHSKISANTGGGLWTSASFCDISSNTIVGSAGSIGLCCTGNCCLIHDNNVTKVPYSGFSIGGNGNIVYRNIVNETSTGLTVRGASNTVYANEITASRVGLSAAGKSNAVYANTVANNTLGIDIGDNKTTATLYHNNFISNKHQASSADELFPATYFFTGLENIDWNEDNSTDANVDTTNYFDNGAEGNYWSDYNGTDADGDGVGDAPYVINGTTIDRYPLTAPFNINSAAAELPEWAFRPSVHLISPENATYTSANVTLEFTINKQTPWIGYSLDGQDTVTITGNTTLLELAKGSHNVTIYTMDTFGNIQPCETTWFNVTEPFPTLPIALAIIAVVVVSVVTTGMLVYFKRRRNNAGDGI